MGGVTPFRLPSTDFPKPLPEPGKYCQAALHKNNPLLISKT